MIEITLFGTENVGDYNDYLEFCEECGYEAASIYSNDYYCWHENEFNEQWEGFEMLMDSDEYNTPVVITGTLGLWFGKREICPTLADNAMKAVLKCIGDCSDYSITEKDGVINVCAKHHDGRNYFEIHKLSQCGIDHLYELEEETECIDEKYLSKFK